MAKKLKDILAMDDNKIADDDHLNRPDITEEEFKEALNELIKKHKLKKVKNKKPSDIALATIEALKRLP